MMFAKLVKPACRALLIEVQRRVAGDLTGDQHYTGMMMTRPELSLQSSRLGSPLKEPVNKIGKGVPISELVIARGSGAAVFQNDEFNDLLLEVIIFG